MIRRLVACVTLLAAPGAAVVSCSLGQGQSGGIGGTLDVPSCWSGRFDMTPDFFAGVPYRDSLQLRIQRGGDFQTFSDGLSILIDDVRVVRGDPAHGLPGHLGEPLKVALPPEVTAPGVPVKAVADPASVHAALYLQRTCRTQDVALYAVGSVTLNADGSCGAQAGGADAGADGATAVCSSATGSVIATSDAGGTEAGPSGGTAASSITFKHLFNNNPEESNAAERLTEATFDFYLTDPREICSGGLGPPPPCRGHLKGDFKFYFERGRPGQPFP